MANFDRKNPFDLIIFLSHGIWAKNNEDALTNNVYTFFMIFPRRG